MCVCMGRGEGCMYAWSCCSPACITIVSAFVQVLDHALALFACCFPHAKLKLGLLIRFLLFFMAQEEAFAHCFAICSSWRPMHMLMLMTAMLVLAPLMPGCVFLLLHMRMPLDPRMLLFARRHVRSRWGALPICGLANVFAFVCFASPRSCARCCCSPDCSDMCVAALLLHVSNQLQPCFMLLLLFLSLLLVLLLFLPAPLRFVVSMRVSLCLLLRMLVPASLLVEVVELVVVLLLLMQLSLFPLVPPSAAVAGGAAAVTTATALVVVAAGAALAQLFPS